MKDDYDDSVKDLDIRSAEDYVLLNKDGSAVLDSEGQMISLFEA